MLLVRLEKELDRDKRCLKCLLRLKNVCTEQEWNEYREKCLEQTPGSNTKRRLDYSSRSVRKGTEGIFFGASRGHVYQLCAESGGRASYRKMYKEIMTYLKEIGKYPNGEDIARKIADEWKQKYRRRSAMMDELGRAGF